MELQLQELLDRIQRDGVEAARAEAEKILAETEARRKAILVEADREASDIVARAKAQATRAEESGRAALAQASRDLLLSVRSRIQAILETVTRAEVEATYGPEVVAQALPAVLGALATGGAEDLSVLLPADLLKKVESQLTARLATAIKGGAALSSSADVGAGFRVSEKGGAAYYDFSASAVAEILSRHLNAQLAEILKSSALES